MHFNINYTCFFFSQWSPRGLTWPINACYFKQRQGRRHGNKNGKKAIDLERAFLCISLLSLHDHNVKVSSCTLCGGRLWKERFPYLPKTFGNFYEKFDRVKNVFHLTQVRFVYYTLVTKIKDGGTDIALNSL